MEGECSSESAETSLENVVSFRVVWNKKNYDVTFNANESVGKLKKHIESLTGKRNKFKIHEKLPFKQITINILRKGCTNFSLKRQIWLHHVNGKKYVH